MAELEFRTVGFAAEAVDYTAAWELQRTVHRDVVEGGPDTVLLLEHPPVFTAGKRTEPHERPFGSMASGVPVVDVDRGGKITFHGPGQLVGYPIVRLPDHVYVVDYVRRLEEALIRTCADLGLATARVPGRSGVWVPADRERSESGPRDHEAAERSSSTPFGGHAGGAAPRVERKVAAIGIRVSQGVAMHGFALNCDIDLSWYDSFVPCGISDAGVTSLSAELGRDVTVAEVAPVAEKHLRALLDWMPYERTPDLPAKPEPGRAPRLIDPAAALG